MTKASRERGIERAIKILDFLQESGEAIVINELAEAIGAPRSTVYDLTKLLIDHSLLDTYGDEGKVFLGRKMMLYGRAYEAQYPLVEQATKFVSDLARETGELSELCSRVDWKQCILHACQGRRPYWFNQFPGNKYPLPLTASGRFLIAGMSREDLQGFIPAGDYCSNGKSVSSPKQFLTDSVEAQKLGYAIVSELVDQYVTAIAMPLIAPSGEIFATISLSFPTGELESKKDFFVDRMRIAQSKIQGVIGSESISPRGEKATKTKNESRK